MVPATTGGTTPGDAVLTSTARMPPHVDGEGGKEVFLLPWFVSSLSFGRSGGIEPKGGHELTEGGEVAGVHDAGAGCQSPIRHGPEGLKGGRGAGGVGHGPGHPGDG